MKKTIKRTTLLSFTLCCLTMWGIVAMVQAEEIAIGNTFGLGARAMGMGGAFLSVADDFTTLYWNPAGLAQIRKFELFTSFSHNEMDAETQFSQSREVTDGGRSKTRPNSIGLVYPLYTTRGGMAFALGYNRAQNFDSRIVVKGIDPSDDPVFGGFDVDETNSDKGGIGIWSLGTGVYVTENIMLGGALDFWYGKSLNELDSIAMDVNDIELDIARMEFYDTVDREYTGLSGRVGALAHLGEYVTLGFTTVFPMNLEVYEVWRQETSISFDDGERESDAYEGDIEYNIERPFEFNGGIAVKLLDKRLTIGTDFQFSDWTQTVYNPLPAEDISRDYFEELYDSAIQIRAGAEYHVSEIGTRLRAGYIHDPIPFQGKEIENDRNFLTVGVGKVFDQAIKVDVAYMRGSWEQSDGSLMEKRTDHRIFFSAAYRY